MSKDKKSDQKSKGIVKKYSIPFGSTEPEKDSSENNPGSSDSESSGNEPNNEEDKAD